ncbi:MAG: hypothetical protein IJD92_00060 [Bacilli bacterium]|nr:hypothetical protein [Bacilli bacterium]
MSKYKYRLCYKTIDGVEFVDINGLKNINENINNALANFDSFDLKSIAILTSMFDNEYSLLTFLKQNKKIPTYVNNLFVTMDEKKKTGKIEYKPIKNGDSLLYSKDTKFLFVKEIYGYLEKNKTNGHLMEKLFEDLYLKYNEILNQLKQKNEYNTKTYNVLKSNKNLDSKKLNELEKLIESTKKSITSFERVVNLYSCLIGDARDIKKIGYDTLSNSAKVEYEKRIKELIIVEFYNYTYNGSLYAFERKDCKQSSFRKVYDFAVYMKLNKDKLETKEMKEENKTVTKKLSGEEEFIDWKEDYKRLSKKKA